MAKRACADCGRDQSLEGGRICEKGHFICKRCVWKDSGFLGGNDKTRCPLDKTALS